MRRCLIVLIVVLAGLVLTGCTAAGSAAEVQATEEAAANACPVTEPVLATPPDDPAVMNDPAPGYYYLNEDRTIWAAAGWTVEGDEHRWHAGKDGNKVGWFRPEGAQMEVTGRRLDAEAAPLTAEIPCCYPTQFQAMGLIFPTEGCWEVTAKAGGSEIRFVVEVEPEP
jgi:hypothetical protein